MTMSSGITISLFGKVAADAEVLDTQPVTNFGLVCRIASFSRIVLSARRRSQVRRDIPDASHGFNALSVLFASSIRGRPRLRSGWPRPLAGVLVDGTAASVDGPGTPPDSCSRRLGATPADPFTSSSPSRFALVSVPTRVERSAPQTRGSPLRTLVACLLSTPLRDFVGPP
jgi:hypothetical protein